LSAKRIIIAQLEVRDRMDVMDESIQRFDIDPQHAAAGDVRRCAIATLSIFGDCHKHHLFHPTGDFSGDEDIAHQLPRSPRHGRRVALCHDEVGRRRKGHPLVEFLVNGLNLFWGIGWLNNWKVCHVYFGLRIRNLFRQGVTFSDWSFVV